MNYAFCPKKQKAFLTQNTFLQNECWLCTKTICTPTAQSQKPCNKSRNGTKCVIVNTCGDKWPFSAIFCFKPYFLHEKCKLKIHGPRITS